LLRSTRRWKKRANASRWPRFHGTRGLATKFSHLRIIAQSCTHDATRVELVSKSLQARAVIGYGTRVVMAEGLWLSVLSRMQVDVDEDEVEDEDGREG